MEKEKFNLFVSKFHMLNSQDNNEEINWSSSSSSDYENCTSNDKIYNINQNGNRKRKRKKTAPKNISNLDVTITDVPLDHRVKKSPILIKKIDKNHNVSPILMSSLPPKNNCVTNSPILNSRNRKSPILFSKSNSPNVRKKLFKDTKGKDDCRISSRDKVIVNNVNIDHEKSVNSEKNHQQSLNSEDDSNTLTDSVKIFTDTESSNSNKVAQIKLINNVKSFFDSHFSSENASQNSISDSITPVESSRTSDDVEILTNQTQFVPTNMNPCIKQEDDKSLNNSNEYSDNSTKKIRYKKDGLAYRLNDLLKKQTANISLWQHEKFLAENSNFIIPKKEHIIFRIQKVNYKYGCYLLEAMDISNDNYLILINNCNVTNIITCDLLFKMYAPYKILDFNKDYKLIINVYKFECISIK